MPISSAKADSTISDPASMRSASLKLRTLGLVLLKTTRWNIQKRYQADRIITSATSAPTTQLERHRLGDTPHIRYEAAVQPVVDYAHTQEESARQHAVGQHHNDSPVDPLR